MTDINTSVNQVAPESPVAAPAENMVPQSRVNEIVHERTAAAAQKARQQALEEFQRNASSQPSSNMGGVSQGPSPDDMRQMIATEARKQLEDINRQHVDALRQQEGAKTVNEFFNKINASEDKYPGLRDKVMKHAQQMPHIIHMANQTEDTPGVMNDLLGNPQKIANLTTLFQLNPDNPSMAMEEMHKLASSIRLNGAAQQQRSANEPLGHLTPSTTGTDSGRRSISDLRKDPAYRG